MRPRSACQALLDHRDRLAAARVLTIGGASVEHSYAVEGELRADAKYSAAPRPRLAGGSSVNHACRLLAMGIDVHPVLPVAGADPLSRVIVEALEEAAQTGGAKYRRSNFEIRGADLTTPFTTIIRQGASRAALNEFSPTLMQRFEDHVERHLEPLAAARRRPDVVMVGHVHADRAASQPGDIGFEGAITERILTAAGLASSRKLVNFGQAQYALGSKRWGRLLRDEVDVFQLDIGEVRRFCADAEIPDGSLESILGWFRSRCTVVISLERFGAIGQLAGSDVPVAAWPYVLEKVTDSTGAGDALGAGLAASMLTLPFDEDGDTAETQLEKFSAALAFGRVCGAYACTTLGGATDCPSLEGLARFEQDRTLAARDAELTRAVDAHDLFLIDRAFDR